jgi:molybdate transport system substrate-binding protein
MVFSWVGNTQANTHAKELRVAVASNFAAPMKQIVQHFEQTSPYRVSVAVGATGQFYAQIKNGAPFAILLAADAATPIKLEKEGLGVAGSRFTYAIGRLVLWSKKPGLVDSEGRILKTGTFSKIAIANPQTSPYGAAATAVLNNLGLTKSLSPKIVQGSNIGQAYQFVASENATVGFVALAQVAHNGSISTGSGWIVPTHLHPPIKQDAILLSKAKDHPAALALLHYLRSEPARTVMLSFGYQLP